ncbi:polysaccharide biosynthesis protein [Thalassotalea sp. G20_0]|uniref:polysaccharide biosynthesis protein n=1 Tax=Thalassotalea sp. G20_0 TaxID=2821093 RepID=UPI001AD9E2E1|nr:nucleoside-diphosphate sugar epimerase/dehydratase [Thalassotalea sp. G20_0]MBO9493581.1 polysaccharide biosynthesis protein [Thalassotalea sp. G20_0]
MIRKKLIALPRVQKRLISLTIDLLIVWVGLFSSFLIRLGLDGFFDYSELFVKLSILSPIIILPICIRLGLYRAVLRYLNSQLAVTLLRVGGLSVAGLIVTTYVLGWDVPRSLPFLFGLVFMLLLGLSRYTARYWLLGFSLPDILMSPFTASFHGSYHRRGKPVAVYGAGDAGCQLVSALDRGWEYRPVLFVDDNPTLEGRIVYGRKVYHSSQLSQLAEQKLFDQVLLALPSISDSKRKAIVQNLEQLHLPVMTMPAMADLASGRLQIQDIKEVEVADLLGREPVAPDEQLLHHCIKGLTVMVTGAGGSIGSELCRQIIRLDCQRLIIFDHSEFNLYQIEQELTRIKSSLSLHFELITVLGSVNDPNRLLDVMSGYQVNTVYHAAAYKHVPIVEHNISQGVRNNVLGTLYTAQAAMVCNVQNFVLISTDKAVRPTNVMGATKRLAEEVLQAFSTQINFDLLHPGMFRGAVSVINNTRFTMVRFGNVLGSSGSVIPKFREQIRSGGPVTVTHPEITRYFMTIPEAALLVIQAGSMGTGGDVFLLDMGEPVKIVDLARHMIRLSGYSEKNEENPEGDISIEFSGLRPGEKLYEELLIGNNVNKTDHPLIYKAVEESEPWGELKLAITEILAAVDKHDYQQVRATIGKHVSGFKPDSALVDWLSVSYRSKSSHTFSSSIVDHEVNS